MPRLRDMKSPISSTAARWRRIISEHILRMSGYLNHLTQLGVNLPNDSVIDRVLQSLPPSYRSFMMNYNMQGMNKTIHELFAMLKAAEVEIKKEHQVLMVNKNTSFKNKGKGNKGNFKKNGKQVAAQVKKPKSGPKPETKCLLQRDWSLEAELPQVFGG